MAASEVFCKDVIDISYKSASFRILEDSMWLQLMSLVFLTIIGFSFVKYLFPINETL